MLPQNQSCKQSRQMYLRNEVFHRFMKKNAQIGWLFEANCMCKWAKLAGNHIWAATLEFQQCDMCDQQSFRSACAYAQSDQSLCLSLAYSMNVKLLTEHHFVFLSLKGDCTGSSESTLVKMPNCWKSHVTAHYCSSWGFERLRKSKDSLKARFEKTNIS